MKTVTRMTTLCAFFAALALSVPAFADGTTTAAPHPATTLPATLPATPTPATTPKPIPQTRVPEKIAKLIRTQIQADPTDPFNRGRFRMVAWKQPTGVYVVEARKGWVDENGKREPKTTQFFYVDPATEKVTSATPNTLTNNAPPPGMVRQLRADVPGGRIKPGTFNLYTVDDEQYGYVTMIVGDEERQYSFNVADDNKTIENLTLGVETKHVIQKPRSK